MMLGKGKLFDAIAAARQQRAHPEVIAILEKSAIIAGSTQAGTWGAELAAYTQPATAFLASLRNFGAFDSALADMMIYGGEPTENAYGPPRRGWFANA